MHFEHPELLHPPPETMLWRYMDFAKFIALLESSAIYLSRLSDFDDPFEGHPPRPVIDAQRTTDSGLSSSETDLRRSEARRTIHAFGNVRHQIYASCWHVSDVESAAMWSLYQRQGEGIAVQSTYASLLRSFRPTDGPLMGGLVQYVDYDTYLPKQLNVLTWATLKRQSFSHEREYRILSFGPNEPVRGVLASVDLDTLVERVYASPTMPKWTSDLLQRVLDRYGLRKTLVRSRLLEAPGYYIKPQ